MRVDCGLQRITHHTCCRDMEALVDACAQPEDSSVPLEQLPNKKVTFLVQLHMLLWRFNVVYWRVPEYSLFRVGATLVVVRVPVNEAAMHGGQ